MNDNQIIALYWQRSETAISETAAVYERYCRKIALNILGNYEDAEECINDTYVKAWAAIPPAYPRSLSAFLGTITRNLAVNLWKKRQTSKRGEGQIHMVLSELAEVLPDQNAAIEKHLESNQITEVINQFLGKQKAVNRSLFVKRYWHTESLEEIAGELDISVSQVKSTLFRMRKSLKEQLEKEGISI